MTSEEEFKEEALSYEKLYHDLRRDGMNEEYLVVIALERLRAELRRAVSAIETLSQVGNA